MGRTIAMQERPNIGRKIQSLTAPTRLCITRYTAGIYFDSAYTVPQLRRLCRNDNDDDEDASLISNDSTVAHHVTPTNIQYPSWCWFVMLMFDA